MVYHQQNALLRGGGVDRDDDVAPANVEAALVLLTELANIDKSVFRRDLCTAQAYEAFEVNRVNRSRCKVVVFWILSLGPPFHVPTSFALTITCSPASLRFPPLPARTNGRVCFAS